MLLVPPPGGNAARAAGAPARHARFDAGVKGGVDISLACVQGTPRFDLTLTRQQNGAFPNVVLDSIGIISDGKQTDHSLNTQLGAPAITSGALEHSQQVGMSAKWFDGLKPTDTVVIDVRIGDQERTFTIPAHLIPRS